MRRRSRKCQRLRKRRIAPPKWRLSPQLRLSAPLRKRRPSVLILSLGRAIRRVPLQLAVTHRVRVRQPVPIHRVPVRRRVVIRPVPRRQPVAIHPAQVRLLVRLCRVRRVI